MFEYTDRQSRLKRESVCKACRKFAPKCIHTACKLIRGDDVPNPSDTSLEVVRLWEESQVSDDVRLFFANQMFFDALTPTLTMFILAMASCGVRGMKGNTELDPRALTDKSISNLLSLPVKRVQYLLWDCRNREVLSTGHEVIYNATFK